MSQPAQAAGVVPTVDDIRREYYEDADWSAWIVEVQLTSDGPVLIIIDDSNGQLVRVPVNLGDNGLIEFGPSVPVLVSYVDAPPDEAASTGAFPPGRKVAGSWGSRLASRRGVVVAGAIARHTTPTDDGTWDGGDNETNLPTEEGTATDYRQCYAWVDPDGDPDTKAAYKFPHHQVTSDGDVGAASTVACSAGIGVLNGGRGGADIPDDDVAGVYAHLAGHLTDSGATPPELSAAGPEPEVQPAGGADAGPLEDPEVEGATRHGAFDGEHEHPHADGEGGVHYHLHSHAKSGKHDHKHDVSQADAGAGPAVTNEGSADVEFSDAQMAGIRSALGKKDGEEVTADELAGAMSRLATTPVIDAAAPETPAMSDGTYLVDGSIIQDWRQRAAAGDAAVTELRIRERDTVLASAVAQGKFPQSRLAHYQSLWDRDPEGTRVHVDTLASGLVPMGGPRGSNPGYDPELPGDFEGQAAYRQLYPEETGRR